MMQVGHIAKWQQKVSKLRVVPMHGANVGGICVSIEGGECSVLGAWCITVRVVGIGR